MTTAPMSLTAFDWLAVEDRLSGVLDDDLRSDARQLAYAIWHRRAARGKACRIPTLCWRAVQLARRRAARDRRVDVCSAAVEAAPARSEDVRETVSIRLHRLTPRQQTIAFLLVEGLGQADIAARIGCSQPTVSRECERIGDTL